MTQSVLWYQPEICQFHLPYPFTAEKPSRHLALHFLHEIHGCQFEENLPASTHQLERAHSTQYLCALKETRTMGRAQGMLYALKSPYLQWYTAPFGVSFTAAKYAAGAVCAGVNEILKNSSTHVFCAVRPPGHHAGWRYGEGFCILNNVAIGALEALARGARVAIIDFDRHHGNGTEGIIVNANSEKLLFISSYQEGCMYATQPVPQGSASKTFRFPLPHGSRGKEVLSLYSSKVVPLIEGHRPDIVMISAGFDLHKNDALHPLVCLDTDDYAHLTKLIVRAANGVGAGIVSVLEGGYTVPSLYECVSAHIEELQVY